MSIVEMRVPTIGESITEVTLSAWLVADGDTVKLDDPICEFESDKATLEFPAEAEGKIIYVASEGDDLEIGALVAKIDTSVSAGSSTDVPLADKPSTDTPAPETPSQPTSGSDHASGHPSPAAAKDMREKGVSADQVQGTGRGGRITQSDVQLATNQATHKLPTETKSPTEPKPVAPARQIDPSQRTERVEKMSRMRRTIAKRLVSAKNNTAMLTTFNEVDLSAVMALRKEHQEAFVKKYGIKLGFMSLFAKACAAALMEMPDVNAFIDGNNVIFHDYVDISIAISTPNGLVVPPLRNVESKGYHEIELEIKELAEKARNGNLSLDEMTGGTFTITNGGIFGSMLSTPILNEPQSAILGMHNIIQRPVAVDGEVVIRPMMYLALSYDHRIIDGSTSVTFLVKVIEYLQDPVRLLIQV